MDLNPAIRDEILANATTLRTFALSLCGTIDGAEDLVQDTLLRALTNVASFQPGTNLVAWLITILRNCFRDQYRKRQREVEDAEPLLLRVAVVSLAMARPRGWSPYFARVHRNQRLIPARTT